MSFEIQKTLFFRMNSYTQKINELIKIGQGIVDFQGYISWNKRVEHFLRGSTSNWEALEFKSINRYNNNSSNIVDALMSKGVLVGPPLMWTHYREEQIGYLEGLSHKQELVETNMKKTPKSISSKKVFIVHGHDNAAKQSVARFIEKLDFEAIILHEQPNSGKTIIEKFETYSDVGFAIVLLTPDDEGRKRGDDSFKSRARQNVVFELGYFIGKLSRQRVCALYKPSTELPSDFQGVLYTEMDEGGAWKMTLAKELKQVGFSIDFEKII